MKNINSVHCVCNCTIYVNFMKTISHGMHLLSGRNLIFFFLLLATGDTVWAQKPFTEGTVVYRVKLESADKKVLKGIYTFTIKGSQIRKELKLNNGYQDIVILNCDNNTVYSIQNRNDKKYAI